MTVFLFLAKSAKFAKNGFSFPHLPFRHPLPCTGEGNTCSNHIIRLFIPNGFLNLSPFVSKLAHPSDSFTCELFTYELFRREQITGPILFSHVGESAG